MAKRREQRRHARVDHPGGEETPIRFELFSNERFEQHARSLAKAQKVGRLKKFRTLIPRVRENALVLLEAHKAVAKAVREQHAITPAAEWLLDNVHVIEEQVSDIHVDLPESYYRELPKLTHGALAGFPRVYGIAWALVAHTDSRFVPELLTLFVRGYQSVEPLTLGELWAIPITLRVLLIENLRRLAVRVMRSQSGRRLADQFVDQFEQRVARGETPDSELPLGVLPEAALRQAYVVQIMQRSHDPHPGAMLSLDFLNDWLEQQGASLEDIVHSEHADQVADNLTMRNIITSMSFGSVDILVNNAGILRDRIFHRMSWSDWSDVINVHLNGSFTMSRASATHFREQKSGSYVHMTSTSGLIGNFGQANYMAAKIGIVGLSRGIALDMARFNVRSNCVSALCLDADDRFDPRRDRGGESARRRLSRHDAGKNRPARRLSRLRSCRGHQRSDFFRAQQRDLSVQSEPPDPHLAPLRRLDARKARYPVQGRLCALVHAARPIERRVLMGSGVRDPALWPSSTTN